ncbi:hypothetical protein [Streptomyces sp. NRRL S-920]|uniref:hypothetical protein n=1 Tax=Streptomyces sp. NRRL S-920 TaxID=1463921 RepID=UPI000AF54B4B|nr:hypothetical protein [Streptomyces sp. NRRL S-920]
MTVAALAVVAVLAVQAEGTASPPAARTKPTASPSKPGVSREQHRTPQLPPNGSGEGRRVVYSLGQDRIWLVAGSGDRNLVTFTAWPGSVDPRVGQHKVTGRRDATTGSDGVPVVRVVYFDNPGGAATAFSAARDGSSPAPAPGRKTGAIRLRSKDSQSLWGFVEVGTRVVVVR